MTSSFGAVTETVFDNQSRFFHDMIGAEHATLRQLSEYLIHCGTKSSLYCQIIFVTLLALGINCYMMLYSSTI